MKKKYYSVIGTGILTSALMAMPVAAKHMTLEELGNIIEQEKDGSYAYIIGDYVFTSDHTLKTQDIMLAARSIDLGENENDLSKMTIHEVNQIYENDMPVWKDVGNKIGSTKLNTSNINVRYIDYKFYPEESNLEMSKNTGVNNIAEEFKEYLNTAFPGGNETNSSNLNLANGKLSGILYKNETVEQDIFGDKTDYYFALVLNIPDATDKTKITVEKNLNTVTRAANVKTKEISLNDFQIKNGENKGIVLLIGLDSNQNNNKMINIKIDMDGTGKEYIESDYTIDWSEIKFQKDTAATISMKDIPSSVLTKLQSWGYSYNNVTFENNKFSGVAIEQTLSSEPFGENNKTGYFVALKITPEMVTEKLSIKITGCENKQVLPLADGSVTILAKLNPETKEDIHVVVDSDGDLEEYKSKEYVLSYKDLTFEKSSISSLNVTIPGNIDLATWGWKNIEEKGYSLKIDSQPSPYKLSGLLPKLTNINSKSEEGYYMVLDIHTAHEKTDKTEVSITDGYEMTILEDPALANKNDIIALVKIDKTKNKAFEITVDLDGASSDDYAPYKIDVNYENVRFQETTTSELSIDVPTNELKTQYGYEKSSKDTYQLSNGTTLTGKVVEHTLKDNTTGYYIALKITPTLTTLDDINHVVVTTSATNYKTFVNDKNIILLIGLEETTEKKIKINVDNDGEGYVYLPQKEYEIDYSQVVLEKNSESIIESEIPSNIDLTPWSWDKEQVKELGYKLTASQQMSEVTLEGLLPKLSNINNKESGFFMVFNIHTTKHPKTNTLTVKSSEGHDIVVLPDSELSHPNDIAVLMKVEPEKAKIFTLTIDLDGTGEEYASYDLTVNYEKVELQGQSEGTVTKDINKEDLKTNYPDYTYQDDNDWEINNESITGTVNQSENGKYYIAFNIKPNKVTLGKTTVKVGETNYTLSTKANVNVLYEIKKEDSQKNIVIVIDYDGAENKYTPVTYTLNYDHVEFRELHTVTFKNGDQETKVKVLHDGTISANEVATPSSNSDYVTFVDWKNGESSFKWGETTITSDITYTANWNISTESFYTKELAPKTLKGITVSKDNETTITLKLNQPKLEMTVLNEWMNSIKSALTKGNVTSIKLAVGEKEETITSSSEIVTQLTTLLESLDKGAGKTITVTINPANENYHLDHTTYTINIEASFEVVHNQEELLQALDKNISTIYIAKEITLDEPLEIKKDITIDSYDGNTKTITMNAEGKPSVIKITSGTVNLKNLTLSKAKSGIEVESGATLNAEKITYAEEDYDKPTVKAIEGSTVKLTKSNNSVATGVKHQKITRFEDANIESFKSIYPGDVLSEDGAVNYYLEDNHSKLFQIQLCSTYFSTRVTFIRYYKYNDTIKEPEFTEGQGENEGKNAYIKYITYGHQFHDRGIIYTLKSFSYDGQSYEKGKLPIVTENRSYHAEYTDTIDPETEAQSSIKLIKEQNTAVKDFIEALLNEKVNAIYISDGITIDLTSINSDVLATLCQDKSENEICVAAQNGKLLINKELKIARSKSTSAKPKIIAKSIELNKDVGVAWDGLEIEVKEGLDKYAINAGQTRLNIYSSSITYTGGNDLDSLIYYEDENVNPIIMWSTLNGNSHVNNIINLNGKVTPGTKVYDVDFEGYKETAIVMNDVNGGEKMDDLTNRDDTKMIRILNSKFASDKYAITFNSVTTTATSYVYFQNNKGSNKFKLNVSDETDFSHIILYFENGASLDGVQMEYFKGEDKGDNNQNGQEKNMKVSKVGQEG